MEFCIHFLAFIALFQFMYAQDQIFLLSQNTQSGQATYYGGAINSGACSINPVPNFAQTTFNAGTLTPAALNAVQYAGGDKSKACGLCLVLNQTGVHSIRMSNELEKKLFASNGADC